LRRQVDELASEKLQIGMDGAEFDFAAEQHAREARRLWLGKGIVEPARVTLTAVNPSKLLQLPRSPHLHFQGQWRVKASGGSRPVAGQG
jgi:hypothetical protein